MAPLNLTLARSLHTLIYAVMAASTLALLYIGLTGRLMAGLWTCPLTAVVDGVAGGAGRVADTFLPDGLTRQTLAIFGPVLPIAFPLLVARWAGVIGQGS